MVYEWATPTIPQRRILKLEETSPLVQVFDQCQLIEMLDAAPMSLDLAWKAHYLAYLTEQCRNSLARLNWEMRKPFKRLLTKWTIQSLSSLAFGTNLDLQTKSATRRSLKNQSKA
jgi:hypothetical protein